MTAAITSSSQFNRRGPLIIAVAAIIMLAWSWQTWCDPLVDFGTQLYVPWQMTAGKVLYRDLAYYNGPLSQYVDAGLFMLLGVSIRTLVLGNLVELIGVLVLIYRLALRASGPIAATMCGLSFVLMFAFGQNVGVGNYNWLTPYTTEITHGIALGILSIALLDRFLRSEKYPWLIGCGFTVGLTFLTKAEPFVATISATLVMLMIAAWTGRWPVGRIVMTIAVLIIAILLVPVIAAGLMSLQMPLPVAIRGVAGSWPWVFDRRVSALPFYRKISGVDDIPGNSRIMLQWAAVYIGAMGAATAIALRAKRPSRSAAIIAFIAVTTAVAICFGYVNWTFIARPLPVCLLVILIIVIVPIVRSRDRSPVHVLRAGLIVFALALMLKIALCAYVFHYGFALAMPGTLVLVAMVSGNLPTWVIGRGGNGGLVRAVAAVGWGTAVLVTLHLDDVFISPKTLTIGEAGDQFHVDGRGYEVVSLVEDIRQTTPANASLVVLPQGLMVNYLARRVTSIPYLNFMPPEILAVGEDRIIAALAAHPPDLIVLDNSNIDHDAFTMDNSYRFGGDTLKWVRSHYQLVWRGQEARLELWMKKVRR